jgi:hypothetical protein
VSVRRYKCFAAIALIAGFHGASAAVVRGPCDDSLTEGIPPRATDALGGHAFAQAISALTDDERESRIRRELLAGNIPMFLRTLLPVRLRSAAANGANVDVIICAAPDYLAIGADDDYLLMPMRLATALSTAADFDLTLPTPRMVDAIYAQASVHFDPQPLPAGSEMRSTGYSLQHNELVGAQRAALETSLEALVAGDKKDLVLSNRLRSHPDRVAIYGWHRSDGKPIQSLSTVHGWRYADYSHGARLISTHVFVDGWPRSIFDVMQDDRLASALSDEGVIADVAGLIESLDGRAKAAVATLLGASPPQRP